MSGHTPGPWHIDNRHFCDYGEFYISCGDYIVARAHGQTQSCETEAEGNARLIAAAPELLEALRALIPHAGHAETCGDMDAYNGNPIPTCDCGLDSALDHALVAIAKATGENA